MTKPLFTSWLVSYDEDEAEFRRPFAERLLLSLLGLGAACLLGRFVIFAYNQGVSGQAILPLGIALFFVVVPIFAFMAGPKELRFDFQRRRYWSRMGFPLLTWTRTGDFDEIASISVWNTKFTGLAIKWKNVKREEFTFFGCTTVEEAKPLAEQLGEKMSIPVKKGGAWVEEPSG